MSIAIVLWVGSSHADPSGDRVLAQTLFDEGRSLMTEGNYAEACPKFAESHRIDPAGGTLLNLGICYRKQGKTASSWATLEEARAVARKEGRADRQAIAEEHLAELEPILSTLRVVVAPNVRVEGLKIALDETSLPSTAWGSKVPTDPGSKTVRATAPGKRPWTKSVVVGREGDAVVVEVPPLVALSQMPIEPVAPVPEEDGSRSTIGYVVGGAGLAVVGVGTYFGLAAFSSWDKRNDACPESGCTQDAVGYADDTRRNADISTVAIGLGLAGVGAGAYLLLSDSSSPEQVRIAPEVSTRGGGLALGGTW